MMSSSSKSSPRKISPSLKQTSTVATTDPDPGQLLNEWLGELDNLQKVSQKIWNFLKAKKKYFSRQNSTIEFRLKLSQRSQSRSFLLQLHRSSFLARKFKCFEKEVICTRWICEVAKSHDCCCEKRSQISSD